MVDIIKCKQCDGDMKKGLKTETSLVAQLFGVIIFFVGVVLLFFVPVGTVVGVVMMVCSLFMGHSRVKGWKCKACGYFFERA